MEDQDKMFAVLTRDSIQLMADAAGHVINDDIAALLAEDVSYRLREVAMKSAAFIKSAKRRQLCPDDFNQALREMDVQPVFGHTTNAESSHFRHVRDGNLHFMEDSDVSFSNIACNSYVPRLLGKTSIKGHWVSVEKVGRAAPLLHRSPAQASSQQPSVSAQSLEYYNQVIHALLGAQPLLIKWAIADLSSNVGVMPVVPYFINFVVSGLKATNRDPSSRLVFMRVLQALLKNENSFWTMQTYLPLLTQTVETCLNDLSSESINKQTSDHWLLQQLSSDVLSQLTRWQQNATGHTRSMMINACT